MISFTVSALAFNALGGEASVQNLSGRALLRDPRVCIRVPQDDRMRPIAREASPALMSSYSYDLCWRAYIPATIPSRYVVITVSEII